MDTNKLTENLMNAAIQNLVLKLPSVFGIQFNYALEKQFAFKIPTISMEIQGQRLKGYLLTFFEESLLAKFCAKHGVELSSLKEEMGKELTNILMGSIKGEFTRTDPALIKSFPFSVQESDFNNLLKFDGLVSNLKFTSDVGNIFVCLALKISN